MNKPDIYIEMFNRLRNFYHRRKFGERTLAIKFDTGGAADRVGEFLPHPNNPTLGVIALYPRKPPDPFKILCTLVHELGHAKSWLEGTRTEAYLAVYRHPNPAELSDKEKQLIMEEEIRAWEKGYQTAQEVGFSQQEEYCAEANRALRFYYDKLKLEPKPFTIAAQQQGL